MTEQQIKEFKNWLADAIEATKEMKRLEYCNIDGLDNYAGHCSGYDYLQLNKKAFIIAEEILGLPIIQRKFTVNEKKLIEKSFRYDGFKVIAIFDESEE